jgi:DNA-binding transcriptional ArsR family regulator
MFEAHALEAEDIAARPRPQYFYPNIVLPPGTLPIQPMTPGIPHSPPPETIAEQLRRLRKESRLTVEALTEALGNIDQRNVERHLSGETIPRVGNIGAYERVFSIALKREIVISGMPVQRR